MLAKTARNCQEVKPIIYIYTGITARCPEPR